MEDQNQNIQQPQPIPQPTVQPVDQPVAQPVQDGAVVKKGSGFLLYFGIIIIVAVLIIGGYLIYKFNFTPPAKQPVISTTTTIKTTESNDKPLETVANRPFESKQDLGTAASELDNTDLNSLNQELDKNDTDASGFTQ
jgi:hypothetical protein